MAMAIVVPHPLHVLDTLLPALLALIVLVHQLLKKLLSFFICLRVKPFFALAGHSIQAISVDSLASARFGCQPVNKPDIRSSAILFPPKATVKPSHTVSRPHP
uniref:Secreted protein n=1 Tax=Bursaphelenchus xylophilus TaxID=6326 RepID=A0A1I7SD51_BURXY